MSGTANKNYLVSASEDLLLFNPIASLAADSLGDVIFDDEEANQFSNGFTSLRISAKLLLSGMEAVMESRGMMP